MRFTASNWDQLESGSADFEVCPAVDRNVWFVAQNVLGTEALSEELLCEDVRSAEFLLKLFLVVAPPVKLGVRAQAAEIGVTADMVPMYVSHEHGRQRRQPLGMRLQGFVCSFRKVRSCAGVN